MAAARQCCPDFGMLRTTPLGGLPSWRGVLRAISTARASCLAISIAFAWSAAFRSKRAYQKWVRTQGERCGQSMI